MSWSVKTIGSNKSLLLKKMEDLWLQRGVPRNVLALADDLVAHATQPGGAAIEIVSNGHLNSDGSGTASIELKHLGDDVFAPSQASPATS